MSSPSADPVHPLRWVPSLYVAEALPFVGTTVVSVLMYKSLGFSDTRIAAITSLVAWPWSLKPLWSGLLESAGPKRRLVAGTQIAAGIALGLMALVIPLPAFAAWSLGLFAIVAFTSASHDIAADGLYIEALGSAQQARYIGYASGFWNLGRVMAAGGLVWLAGRLEVARGPVFAWTTAMLVFGAVLVLLGIYHGRALPPAPAGQGPRERTRDLGESVATFFRKRHVWAGLAFVVLYRFAEGQAMKILPLFLRASRDHGGLGLSTETVGITYGTFGAVACIAGSILGGHFAAGRPLRDRLLPLCLVFNVPYLAYVFLAWTQPSNLWIVTAAVVVEWFGYGFGFVAVTLFMMQQMASGRYKMSHYAIATSAMNLGLLLPGLWSGWLSDHLGYRNFFSWVVVACTVSLVAAWRVPVKSGEELALEEAAPRAA